MSKNTARHLPLIAVIVGVLIMSVTLAFAMGNNTGLAALPPPNDGHYLNWAYHARFGPCGASSADTACHMEYLASVKPGGQGDNVIVSAFASPDTTFFNSAPSDFWYRIYLNHKEQNGDAGTNNYEAQCANAKAKGQLNGIVLGRNRIDMTPCSFSLIGDEEGPLDVQLWTGNQNVPVAEDHALVSRGNGDIAMLGNQHVFAVGDQLRLNVQTGSCGVRAYSPDPAQRNCFAVDIVDPTNAIEKTIYVGAHNGGTAFGQNAWQTITWTIPPGAFHACDPAWQGQWNAVLRNDYANFRQVEFFTVDQHSLTPPAPTLNASAMKPIVGQPLTVSVTASTSTTASTLTTAQYTAWYGNPQEQPVAGDPDSVAVSQSFPLTSTGTKTLPNGQVVNTYAGSFQVPVSKEGNLQLSVIVRDSNCRPSEPGQMGLVTANGAPATLHIPRSNTSTAIIVVALLLGAGAVAAVVLFMRNPMHKWVTVAGLGLGVLVFVGIIMLRAGGTLA